MPIIYMRDAHHAIARVGEGDHNGLDSDRSDTIRAGDMTARGVGTAGTRDHRIALSNSLLDG
jgi:hypothetical protein